MICVLRTRRRRTAYGRYDSERTRPLGKGCPVHIRLTTAKIPYQGEESVKDCSTSQLDYFRSLAALTPAGVENEKVQTSEVCEYI